MAAVKRYFIRTRLNAARLSIVAVALFASCRAAFGAVEATFRGGCDAKVNYVASDLETVKPKISAVEVRGVVSGRLTFTTPPHSNPGWMKELAKKQGKTVRDHSDGWKTIYTFVESSTKTYCTVIV